MDWLASVESTALPMPPTTDPPAAERETSVRVQIPTVHAMDGSPFQPTFGKACGHSGSLWHSCISCVDIESTFIDNESSVSPVAAASAVSGADSSPRTAALRHSTPSPSPPVLSGGAEPEPIAREDLLPEQLSLKAKFEAFLRQRQGTLEADPKLGSTFKELVTVARAPSTHDDKENRGAGKGNVKSPVSKVAVSSADVRLKVANAQSVPSGSAKVRRTYSIRDVLRLRMYEEEWEGPRYQVDLEAGEESDGFFASPASNFA